MEKIFTQHVDGGPMPLPRYIKIGGASVEIIFPHDFDTRSGLLAEYSHHRRQMKIAGKDLNFYTILESFIHETLHAIDKTAGHCLFDENESALDGISEGLVQVLLENKQLFRDILDNVE